MQTFAWLGFQFEHPDDWECVRFSKNRQRGECALADPRGRRLSLCWSALKTPFGSADANKILNEEQQQLGKSDPEGQVSSKEWKGPGSWRGFEWKGAEDLTVALAHFGEAGYLLQAQFSADRRTDAALQRRVLESVNCQATGAGAAWRWRAFGCDVTLPNNFEVETCEVFPGHSGLSFRTRGGGRKSQKVKVDRYAIPEQQLNGRSLKEWFAGTLESSRTVLNAAEAEIRGHRGVSVKLKPGNPTPLQFITRVRRESHGAAWVCEKEARLYRAEWEGVPAGSGVPDLTRLVGCCSA
jgi:hypothetical protein